MKYISYVFLCSISLCSSQSSVEPTTPQKPSPIPRVVGGMLVDRGEMPYLVSFKRKTRLGTLTNVYAGFCGGTIIKPSKILSAAHCFFEDYFEPFVCFNTVKTMTTDKLTGIYAVAGSTENLSFMTKDFEGQGQWRSLDMVICPENFAFPVSDIAIAMTNRPFIITAVIKPIDYATKYQEYRGRCIVAGFGETQQMSGETTQNLLKAPVLLGPRDWCKKFYLARMKESICIKRGPRDVGRGDSGGPLVCAGTNLIQEGPYGLLVGIISGVVPGSYSFFTRVSEFTEFIESNGCRRNSGNLFDSLFIVIYFSLGFII